MVDLNVAVAIVGKDLLSPAADSASKALAGLGAASKAAKDLLPAVTIAAAGLTAGLVSTVKTASEFEATMSGVKAVMSTEEVTQFGTSLEKLALQLGKDTTYSAKEAAAGIEELIKGGLSAQDVLGGAAKSTLALASAGGVDLKEAAIIAANALAQFNLKGGDMAHVADLIAGAANASALDVGQFKFSLQAAGAVASTVGFSFDDLAQAIAVMGKAGIVGSDAGTSLKTMMLNLQPQTKDATAEMMKLGLMTKEGGNAFFDASGKVKSMSEVAGLLQGATKNLTEQQRLQALQTLFGSDAIRAAAVLAKEGATGFNEMAASMGKVSAEAVGAARLDNLSGSMKALTGSIETVQIELGQKLIPLFRPLVDGATNVINAFLGLSDEWKTNIAIGGVVVTALAVVTAGALALIAVLPAIVAGFTAVGTIATFVGGILLGPVVLAIGAVVAAGFLLYEAWTNNWGGIQEKTAAVWEFLQNNVFTPIATELARFGEQVLPEAQKAWEGVSAGIQRAWGTLVVFLQPGIEAFGAFWAMHHDTIMRVASVVWDAIAVNVRVAWDLVSGIILAGLKLLQGDWQGAWEVLKAHLSAAWNDIHAVLGSYLTLLGEAMGNAWAGIKGAAASAWAGIRDTITGLFAGIMGPIQGVISQVMGLIQPVMDKIGQIASFRPPDLSGALNQIAQVQQGAAQAASAASAAASAGVGNGLAYLGSLPGRAVGGPVTSGMPYIVGENRPELFVPQTSGYILPSVPSMGAPGSGWSGGGGVPIDYDRLINGIAGALSGVTMQVDGQAFGRLARTQDRRYARSNLADGIGGIS